MASLRDTNEFPFIVHDGAAAVSGVDGGRHSELGQIIFLPGGRTDSARYHAWVPAQARTERVAQCMKLLAHLYPRTVAETEPGASGPHLQELHHGQVVPFIFSDDTSTVAAPFGEADLNNFGFIDDVEVRHDMGCTFKVEART